MTATQVSSRASAGAPRHALIERRLRRYAPAARARVRALAERHPRLADLALSFPPLLFALALPRLGQDAEPAIACAIEGRPLGEVAAAAGVPRWLRRLPVEGLTRPLPMLPAGELFGRRIVNHLPRSPKLTAAWLEVVADAAQWGSEPLGIWFAREIARDPKVLAKRPGELRLLAVWTWFSQQADTQGYRLMATPWRFDMRFDAAVDAARAWHQRVSYHLSFCRLGEWRIADPWLQPGRFEGHDFVLLDSAERLAEEADAMENCLRTYCYEVADDHCRVWSIRREGQRIASFEVRRHQHRPLLYIEQLSGPRNESAPIEVWWLAARWLHQHDLVSIRPEPRMRDGAGSEPETAGWRELWRPYWRAKRRVPIWLPLGPSWRAFDALR
jgi:hypothetical protein